MGRKKDAAINTRTAREKLQTSGQPHYRQITRGLSLGYRKGKTLGVWVARWRDGKRYVVETIGVADSGAAPEIALSAADLARQLDYDAARAKAETLAKARRATHPSGERAAPLTVAEAVTAYLDWLDHHGKAAISARHRAEADIIPALGTLQVDRLTSEILERWLQNLGTRPRRTRDKAGQSRALPPPVTADERRRRKSTANRTWTVLRAALNRAFRAKRIASDSAWRTVTPFKKVDGARLRTLSRDEARRLIAGCAPDFRALASAALLSGCRYGELCRLRVDDFNPKSGTLHVAESKSGSPRHVTLTTEAIEFFSALAADYVGGGILLRRGDGTPWCQHAQTRPMREACERAQIAPITFHGLRHTFASLAVDGRAAADHRRRMPRPRQYGDG